LRSQNTVGRMITNKPAAGHKYLPAHNYWSSYLISILAARLTDN
jgi:hypothetical protein